MCFGNLNTTYMQVHVKQLGAYGQFLEISINWKMPFVHVCVCVWTGEIDEIQRKKDCTE